MRFLIACFCLTSIIFFLPGEFFGQAKTLPPTKTQNQPNKNQLPRQDSNLTTSKDTTREFEIIRGPSMRMMQTDTGTLQIIAGGAIVKQEGTKFSADSVILNNDTRIMQAYGNVHINDGDTVNIYSQYLYYNGFEKYCFLKGKIKLTGRNGTLHTEELDYNLNSGIGNYYKGGRIINKKNIITSQTGTYYSDTKDVYFKQNVKMDGPKDHIRADSLIYNMNDGNITFVSETFVKNNEVEIRTSEGRYDTNTGNAFFSTRTNVKDSSGRIYTANNMALEGQSGNAQLEGNAVIIDSANGFSVIANQIFLNKKENSFFATKKPNPVLILKHKNDSTYVAADVIYSGLARMIHGQLVYSTDSITELSRQQTEKIVTVQSDTTGKNINGKIADTVRNHLNKQEPFKIDSLHRPGLLNDRLPPPSRIGISKNKDTTIDVHPQIKDSLASPPMKLVGDTLNNKEKIIPPGDTLKPTPIDTLGKKILQESLEVETRKDTTLVSVDTTKADSSLSGKTRMTADSLKTAMNADTSTKVPDSTRFFIAYHNVRIYNDSLQSVCDSLFISSRDSVFRLYREPVIWSGETQVTGDTMFLFTKNKEAERLFVFDRSFVVNRTKEGFFNQVSGKTLNAYFKDSKFDHIRIKGSQSESIYYLQDDDSSYFGMNRATGDVIDMLFNKGELLKILLINQVKGKMFPMNQIPEDQRFLKGYEWLDKRRPKNRAELFQ